MVGASLAARRAEPTSCQHPFPSRGFDSFAKPQGNDRNSRDADGRSRRLPVIPGVDIAIGGSAIRLRTARVAVIPPAPRPCAGRQ